MLEGTEGLHVVGHLVVLKGTTMMSCLFCVTRALRVRMLQMVHLTPLRH